MAQTGTNTEKPNLLMAFFSKINDLQYRSRRRPFIRYLASTAGVRDERLAMYFQPRYLPVLKVTLFFMAARYLYGFHYHAGKIMQYLAGLFKLEQIYRFRFPADDFFIKVSSVIFLVILAYFGVWFIVRQVQGLLSGLVIDRNNGRLYYVSSNLITTSLFIFNMPEIDVIVLHQNILTRLLKIGTVELRKTSGEKIIISSLHNAPQAVSGIAQIKRP